METVYKWRKITLRFLDIARTVWEAVKEILCADAPEGYEVGDHEDEVEVNTKALLSFCWRALKESRYQTNLRDKHCS